MREAFCLDGEAIRLSGELLHVVHDPFLLSVEADRPSDEKKGHNLEAPHPKSVKP